MAGDAVIVAGFGFRVGATQASLADALDRAAAPGSVTGLATAADKAEAPAFRDLAKVLEVPIHAIPDKDLAAQTTLTQSTASHATRGVGSVAEAAALAAAGPAARLLAARVISADGKATCALAEGEGP